MALSHSKTPKTRIHLPFGFYRFNVDPPGEQVDSHYKTAPKFSLVSLMKENTRLQHDIEFSAGEETKSYSTHNNKKHVGLPWWRSG